MSESMSSPRNEGAGTTRDGDVARRALAALRKLRGQLDAEENTRREPLAIVGLGCRLPGSPDVPAFWRLLSSGGDAVRPIPSQRWDVDYYSRPDPASDFRVVHQAGLLDQIDQFDAPFFGITGREAQRMDPQQRLLLEVVWEALENAGIPPTSLQGSRTGVFVGTTTTDYLQLLTRRLKTTELDAYIVSGNTLNATAGRVAYVLGLQGPTIAMDTACSSSLVAVDRACRSVRDGECRLAIAAGVNLILGPELLVCLARWGMLAPDGRCKTFDASADGFVRAEGCGVILLKRLSHAIADGDTVLALIRGSAVNQDGRSSGFAVPNGLAQASVIRDALAAGGVEAASIGYVEAHGTGTPLGDPIEMEALNAVYGSGRDPARPLVVGAVKTNVGHLEAAAGITGLIKTVLSLQHRQIPPNLHYHDPSPNIPWDEIPVRIPVALTPWEPIDGRRLAGVSSFGFSGTNVHVIVEEAPAQPEPAAPPVHGTHLLTVSARSVPALRSLAGRYAELLESGSVARVASICAAASAGRAHLSHRLAVSGRDGKALADQLRAIARGDDQGSDAAGPWRAQVSGSARPGIAFLFTGQGAQYAGMGRHLAQASPVFRSALERCAAVIDPLLPRPLLDVIFDADAGTQLNQTRFTQPALFAIQWGLVEWWRSRGVLPSWVLGHSVGEFAAACCAGVLQVEDAARLVALRGSLMQDLPAGGAMAAVFASEAIVAEHLARGDGIVTIAGLNGAEEVVVSGEAREVTALRESLQRDGIHSEALAVSHAFHSPLMQPMREAFGEAARGLARSAPQVAVVSTLTGALAAPDWGTAEYWLQQLQAPVRYADALRTAVAQPGMAIALEIGPHPVLTGLGRRNLPDAPVAWLPSMRRERDDWATVLATLGNLYVRGAVADWSAGDGVAWRGRETLPTYPFQRTRYWLDRPAAAHDDRVVTAPAASASAHPLLGDGVPLASVDQVFQVEAGGVDHLSLREHRLHGHSVWPATASLEMLLAAARRPGRAAPIRLTGIQFAAPLMLPDDRTVTVQTILRAHGSAGVDLCRKLAVGSAGDWSSFARANAIEQIDAEDAAGPLPGFEAARARCTVPVDAGPFYAAQAQRGAQFGPTFLSLEQVWRASREGDRQAFGRVRVPERGDPLAGRCLLHPILLDGAVQLVSVAAGDWSGDDRRLLVPAELAALHWFAQSDGPGWAHATLRDGPAGSPVVADVRVWRDDGVPIAFLEGLRFERVSARALGLPAAGLLARAACTREWQALLPSDPVAAGPGAWLLLGDGGGLVLELAKALRAQGAEVHIGTSATELRADHVVQLGALDLPCVAQPSGMLALLQPLIESSLGLVRAASSGREASVPRLWWLTRGALRIGGDSAPMDEAAPLGAALWGFGRSLRSEHPGLAATMIDISGPTDVNALVRLMLSAAPRESELALRGSEPLVARLRRWTGAPQQVRSDDPVPPAPARKRFGWTAPSPGSIDDLVAVPLPDEPPAADQVLIEVRAAGLNFRDVLCALGLVQGVDPVLGGECAGIVRAVGASVADIRVGDEVVAIAPSCLASHVTVPRCRVARKPAGIDFEQAAALPVAFLTAIHGLEQLGGLTACAEQPRVLIHSGAGGVGMAAIQVALAAGARVFATAGSHARRARLQALGVEQVFDSRTLDFREQVLAATQGQGVDLVLNALTGEFIPASFDVLAPGGRFLEMGKRDIWPADRVAERYPGIAYVPFDLFDAMAADPALAPWLFDRLLTRLEQCVLKPLPVEAHPLNRPHAAFRSMMQSRHVGKVVLRHDPADESPVGRPVPPPPVTMDRLRDDASYLVTGALGSIGLAVAEEMVARGARHLLLIGRSAPDPQAIPRLDRLRAQGVRLRVEQCDVADGVALGNLLDGCRPTLRGVVHAAGRLDDGMIEQQSWPRFAGVLLPKLIGASNLDRLTRGLDLDFFVLFSAGAGWVGAPGQANYASANTAMDAIADLRRSLGLPGLSIAWGRWDGDGMAAGRSGTGARDWDSIGVEPIATADGLAALFELAERVGGGALGVLPLQWRRYLDYVYPAGAPACFGEVALTTHPVHDAGNVGSMVGWPDREVGEPAPDPFVQALRAAPAGQRADLLRHRLETLVRRVAGVAPEQTIEYDRPLRELGMDSLMTVELRNAISRTVGSTLSATLVFDHPSLDALTAHLMATLPGLAEPAEDPASADNVVRSERTRLVASVRSLSEDEAEAELLRELSGRVRT